ncbi:T3SS effector HopA1 family protein [Sciscionella sediminilitoris]|uniref:T3SS effector HopA1 family protein n=1 Tax=Sciscionella sediminilitoris TaxID=1445613 RepID=UPI00068D645E|nr:T3SS effector HopA1 family protein [Sciscionella sp. SE31]
MPLILSPGLAAALETVHLDPPRARVGGRMLVAASTEDLRTVLAGEFYARWHTGAANTDPPEPDAGFERELRAAVPHAETRRDARLVAATPEELTVWLDGVRVRVPAAALRGRPDAGTVTIGIGACRPRRSPGYLLVDGSRGHGLTGEHLLRVYAHLTDPEHTVSAWRTLLGALEERSVPYRAKVVSARSLSPRRDALVLYLGPAARTVLADVVALAGPWTGTQTSLFAHRLAPGLAMAWEPLADAAGRGFGTHRCLAVADGLLRHARSEPDRTRAETVAATLLEYGIDPVSPHRNTSSPEL